MTRKLLLSIFIFIALFSFEKVNAQFPYFESFKNKTAPGVTFGGDPVAYLTANSIDPDGDGYLRLTSNDLFQKGYIYSDRIFPSTFGLKVDFEYFTYGGNGADGITFFLFDAAAEPAIGSFGGSLGYAQFSNNAVATTPGVSKGYLGIGLDEYGNFSNPSEGRQGGPGFKPGSVTIRGQGDGAALTSGNYSYLTSLQTSELGFSLTPPGGNTTTRYPLSSNPGYRKVFINLKPNPTGGYDVSIKILVGGIPTQTYTVISNYHYTQTAPSNLKYGIASSTGSLKNFHEIRNVSVDVFDNSLANNPVAKNDLISACVGEPISKNVLANDSLVNPNSSFNMSSIDLNPDVAGVQVTRDIAGKGTFDVNSSGVVTFTPLNSTVTGVTSIFYSVKDNFGFAAEPATIAVTIYPLPPNANAGPDQIVNKSTALTYANLAGVNNPGISGKWTQISGPNVATYSNVVNPFSQVSNLAAGDYIFRWRITPGGSCFSEDDVSITVNDIPISLPENISTNANTNVIIKVLENDTDVNGNNTIDKGTLVVKMPPLHGTTVIDIINGTVTYKPNNGYSGVDFFNYTVKDNFGAESLPARVTIAVDVKPKGDPDVDTTVVNVTKIIDVKKNDINIVPVTITQGTSPLHGKIVINPNGTISYQPETNFHGIDNFTYILKNADGDESAPINVTVYVRPVGSPDVLSTPVNTPLTIVSKDNDISKLETTIVLESTPLHGTVLVNSDNTVTYTPNKDFSGKDNYIYHLLNLEGLKSDPILVSISIKPVGTNDKSSTPINTPVQIKVTDNDISKIGTTIIKKSNPLYGVVILNPDGTFTYTPKNDFKGKDTFSYSLINADGIESDQITVTIDVSSIFIPAGFSPNNDGINDYFILYNTASQTLISLEVYNRWGNLVHRSSDYKNGWDGKCTEGIHVGEDVPAGTYYYIVILNNKDSYTGYLTINR
ncbi:MAG: hypothetical protein JWN56_738 [Sphingobacteriales bacterium]|nr:hypothetical protein [Sphingobacteriales bacterium]